ncbi:MAG: hypothetical protein ACR2QH_19700 [Geminicoccaceae bacterium]
MVRTTLEPNDVEIEEITPLKKKWKCALWRQGPPSGVAYNYDNLQIWFRFDNLVDSFSGVEDEMSLSLQWRTRNLNSASDDPEVRTLEFLSRYARLDLPSGRSHAIDLFRRLDGGGGKAILLDHLIDADARFTPQPSDSYYLPFKMSYKKSGFREGKVTLVMPKLRLDGEIVELPAVDLKVKSSLFFPPLNC